MPPAPGRPAEDRAKPSPTKHRWCVLKDVLVFRDVDRRLTKAERAGLGPLEASTQSWAAADRGHEART